MIDKNLWEELAKVSEKEEREHILESIQEEDARKIFDKYSSRYDDVLRRLS